MNKNLRTDVTAWRVAVLCLFLLCIESEAHAKDFVQSGQKLYQQLSLIGMAFVPVPIVAAGITYLIPPLQSQAPQLLRGGLIGAVIIFSANAIAFFLKTVFG